MSTEIRPELSKRNKYWIDRHRYYELKHFCLQYPTWKKEYLYLDGLSKQELDSPIPKEKWNYGDPTVHCVEARDVYKKYIDMVEQTAQEADKELAIYILNGVTEGHNYDYLKSRLDIPCCKDVYYELYRRFFWLLSNKRL